MEMACVSRRNRSGGINPDDLTPYMKVVPFLMIPEMHVYVSYVPLGACADYLLP